MHHSIKKGISFGLSSAIITTLGIIAGTHSATDLKHAIIAAVLVVAIADSFSDLFGVSVSEKSSSKTTSKEAWTSALTAFLTKLIITLSFILPIVLIENLHTAIIINVVYGLILLGIYGYFLAKNRKENIIRTILSHVLLALAIILVSHYLGDFIEAKFS